MQLIKCYDYPGAPHYTYFIIAHDDLEALQRSIQHDVMLKCVPSDTHRRSILIPRFDREAYLNLRSVSVVQIATYELGHTMFIKSDAEMVMINHEQCSFCTFSHTTESCALRYSEVDGKCSHYMRRNKTREEPRTTILDSIKKGLRK